MELDERNKKAWNPKTKPGYNKEFHLPQHLQELLHEPMYDLQDILKQNKEKLGDKVVVGRLLS